MHLATLVLGVSSWDVRPYSSADLVKIMRMSATNVNFCDTNLFT